MNQDQNHGRGLGLLGRKVGMMRIFTDDGDSIPEFRVEPAKAAEFKPGDTIAVSLFEAGQKVDVQGVSIGKGYAGTIKRHNFRSGRQTHGNSRSHNVPGSIGMAQDPGRVFPGKRMTGHMGDVTCTVQNLEIARIDSERQLILVKGAVPGAKNGQVILMPAVKAKINKGA
ncbi:MAG: 50S ribosomal protein L3 [Oxalobacteraceae bacterium]|nr:50S ribosomal protein L3 [Oxalobacteraceae bacterium]